MLGIKIYKVERQQPGKQDAKRCPAELKRSNKEAGKADNPPPGSTCGMYMCSSGFPELP